eukprot:NODE_10606_length_504_cov_4.409449_g9956_i0.p1 GENE.NODE_10606_length_504_cov_4.409449_g9956_i0~~NODE_10606_length_504_cov_4.409449_g9956_i0.p1  ORF type:complete len:157 (-),score=18.67 NODE_10606_length_504_cov_4.409449_g9956_i0:11-481(-)
MFKSNLRLLSLCKRPIYAQQVKHIYKQSRWKFGNDVYDYAQMMDSKLNGGVYSVRGIFHKHNIEDTFYLLLLSLMRHLLAKNNAYSRFSGKSSNTYDLVELIGIINTQTNIKIDESAYKEVLEKLYRTTLDDNERFIIMENLYPLYEELLKHTKDD